MSNSSIWEWFKPAMASLVVAMAWVSTAQAADASFYTIYKGRKYNQSSAGPSLLGTGNPYRFGAAIGPAASGSLVSGTVSGGSVNLAVAFDPVTEWYTSELKYPSQAALDAAEPAGNYTVQLTTLHDGQRTITLSMPAETFPSAPHVSNWTAAQSMTPGADFTVTWDKWPEGTANDYIYVYGGDINTGQMTFRSASPSQSGALNGTSTGFTIPGKTLQPSTPYLIEIRFLKMQSANTTNYPGAYGLVAFNSFTDVGLMTTATPVELSLSFRHLAQGGSFLNSPTATPSFPVSINAYRAELLVSGSTNYPAPGEVLFTGPPGSGLTNSACSPGGFSAGPANAVYFSDKITRPPMALAGTWSISFQGKQEGFPEPNLQPLAHLIVPVPAAKLANGVLQSVSWKYYDANGNALLGTPSALSSIDVQAFSASSGALTYDSGFLAGATFSYSFTNSLPWADLGTLRFLYMDNVNNSYAVAFNKVTTSNPIELTPVSYSMTGGFVFRLSGDVGHGYDVEFANDLVHWTSLITTNLNAASVQIADPQATGAQARFYRARLTN